MKVNLNIEEDAQFRQYVKEMIAGEVRSILRHELAGIVHAELTKMRLLDPSSEAMSNLVTGMVKKRVEEATGRVAQMAREQVRYELQTILEPLRMKVLSLQQLIPTK